MNGIIKIFSKIYIKVELCIDSIRWLNKTQILDIDFNNCSLSIINRYFSDLK